MDTILMITYNSYDYNLIAMMLAQFIFILLCERLHSSSAPKGMTRITKENQSEMQNKLIKPHKACSLKKTTPAL